MKKILVGLFLVSALAFGNYESSELHYSYEIGTHQTDAGNLEKDLQTIDNYSGTVICQVVPYHETFIIIFKTKDAEKVKEKLRGE